MALYGIGKNISKYIQNHVFKLRARGQSSPPPAKTLSLPLLSEKLSHETH